MNDVFLTAVTYYIKNNTIHLVNCTDSVNQQSTGDLKITSFKKLIALDLPICVERCYFTPTLEKLLGSLNINYSIISTEVRDIVITVLDTSSVPAVNKVYSVRTDNLMKVLNTLFSTLESLVINAYPISTNDPILLYEDFIY